MVKGMRFHRERFLVGSWKNLPRNNSRLLPNSKSLISQNGNSIEKLILGGEKSILAFGFTKYRIRNIGEKVQNQISNVFSIFFLFVENEKKLIFSRQISNFIFEEKNRIFYFSKEIIGKKNNIVEN